MQIDILRRSRLAVPALALAVLATAAQVAAQAPGDASPGEPYIEEMTWTEIRDAMENGKTVAIVPVGGTEQNGPHMVMGKHNYIITHAAGVLARRLGNALVAPTVAWVPEGDYTSESFGERPGVISLP